MVTKTDLAAATGKWHLKPVPVFASASFIAVAWAIVCFTPAYCGEPQFRAVTVGNGPLLFVTHPERVDGARLETIYVVDPAAEQEPQMLWQGDVPTPEPVGRLGRDTVLIRQMFQLFVLDLAQGTHSAILPNDNQTKLVAIDHGKVFFLERAIADPLRGYKLRSGKNNETVVKDYYRPCDRLYSFDVSGIEPAKLVTGTKIERVLAKDHEGFWVITAGDDRALARIQLNGTVERIIPFDSHWVAPDTKHEFSPDGKYLALALLHDEHDFHSERELIVIDLAEKRVAYSAERTSVENWDEYSGGGPWLDIRWLDETRLSFGMFFSQVVDIKRGSPLSRSEATRIRKKVPVEREPERKTVGCFDHRFGLLYFKGRGTPVASVLDDRNVRVTDLAISPEGEWAAFVSPRDRDTYIVDGKHKQKSLLLSGWSYDITWLPAVNKSDDKEAQSTPAGYIQKPAAGE